MKKLPLITLFLASAVASTNAWAGDLVSIDFEQGIEVFDLHSNGLPTRLETQGYTFYASGGIATANASGGSIAWCPSPGCVISMYDSPEATFDKLKSLDIAAAPIGPGTGTVRVIGVTWDFSGIDPNPISISKVVSFGPSLTTHVFDGEWETRQLQRLEIEILTNTGGPVLLDNIVVDTGYIEVGNVGIDVQPYDATNYVNTDGGNGSLMQVAIEGSANFDVTQVDTATVQFGPANAEVYSVVPGNNDNNGDGYDDLRVKFAIADTGITCEYPDDVTLTGIADGVDFEGSDLVTTPACEVGGCHP